MSETGESEKGQQEFDAPKSFDKKRRPIPPPPGYVEEGISKAETFLRNSTRQHENETIQDLYDKATAEQAEYAKKGVSDIEEFLISEAKDEISILENKDWPNRNKAIKAVIRERVDNPMDANFDDVIKILEGQIKDVNEKFNNKVEVEDMRNMQRIAETMRKGGKIKYEDSDDAKNLNGYLQAMLQAIEGGIEYAIDNIEGPDKNKDLAEANKVAAVFERLYQMSNEYPFDDSEEIRKRN